MGVQEGVKKGMLDVVVPTAREREEEKGVEPAPDDVIWALKN